MTSDPTLELNHTIFWFSAVRKMFSFAFYLDKFKYFICWLIIVTHAKIRALYQKLHKQH